METKKTKNLLKTSMYVVGTAGIVISLAGCQKLDKTTDVKLDTAQSLLLNQTQIPSQIRAQFEADTTDPTYTKIKEPKDDDGLPQADQIVSYVPSSCSGILGNLNPQKTFLTPPTTTTTASDDSETTTSSTSQSNQNIENASQKWVKDDSTYTNFIAFTPMDLQSKANNINYCSTVQIFGDHSNRTVSSSSKFINLDNTQVLSEDQIITTNPKDKSTSFSMIFSYQLISTINGTQTIIEVTQGQPITDNGKDLLNKMMTTQIQNIKARKTSSTTNPTENQTTNP